MHVCIYKIIMHILQEHPHILKVHIKHIKITILIDGRRKMGIKGDEVRRERVKEKRETLLPLWTRVTPLHPVCLGVFLCCFISTP